MRDFCREKTRDWVEETRSYDFDNFDDEELMMINLIDNFIKWYDYLMMQLMLSFVAVNAIIWDVFSILFDHQLDDRRLLI